MLRHPGVACVVRYRLQCFFYANGLAPLGWLMKSTNLVLYGVQIHERARIGSGLYMGHAATILITENVSIGERCVLYHQNTIGLSPFAGYDQSSGVVKVGDDVAFGGGACAYGDIVIGDRCRNRRQRGRRPLLPRQLVALRRACPGGRQASGPMRTGTTDLRCASA